MSKKENVAQSTALKKPKKKRERKKSAFLKDFKAFITKGNVIDMAVGVVIGGSFGKIVTGLVNYIINPFVGIFIKNGSLDSIKTVIHEAVLDAEGNVTSAEIAILWGTWLQTIIDFLITALCIFIVLRIIMKMKNKLEAKKIAEEKQKADEAAAKTRAEKELSNAAAALAIKKEKDVQDSLLRQEALLSEIRDALKSKK